MTENDKRILDEQKFPYENMSLEERNYYLNIIKHCKDICDTNNKVDDCSKCEIVEMRLKKSGNIVHINGSLSIGKQNKEYRCVDGDIYLSNTNIVIDMKITRLNVDGKFKEYSLLDEFYIENDILKRRSQYNYNMKSSYSDIVFEEMKGKLR